ncbi:HlyD family secretion protein [Desulfobulbus sp.]|uniref:HlyD family secretion protein n=1 Tax=Desulfobulbus sp. TaxID=895 RepID=UPI0027B9C9C2|nr:HlyD family efflux transporter periplasmic adaptor subunit [Desulfobulbus sp.]
MTKKFLWWISLAALTAIGLGEWRQLRSEKPSEGLVSSGGHIETKEFDIVAPKEGRIAKILVPAGGVVACGQTLARMDARQLEAQLHEARINLLQARKSAETARSQLEDWMKEKTLVLQHATPLGAEMSEDNDLRQNSNDASSDNVFALQHLQKADLLPEQRQRDVYRARAETAMRRIKVTAVRSQLFAAQSAVIAAETAIERLKSGIDACVVKAPCTARVLQQYAKDGDLLAQGGRVLQLLDLREVNMTFFRPAHEEKILGIGTEVRVALDLASPIVLPAQVSSIAGDAQFSHAAWGIPPDQHEPQIAVRVKIAPELIKVCGSEIKGGVTGWVYVRFDKNIPWPAVLGVRCPDAVWWPCATAKQRQ